ncbi:hypothetical protein RZS08_23305, partial [Arthrospira platensis SPKY1]|nr:hypothetical protein [Arthrospira platensis SPKY1]
QEPGYLHLDHIERFIRLVYRFVDPKEDIHRPSGEAYSPEARDEAQQFRSSLLPYLAGNLEPKAETILRSLASDSSFEEHRDWLMGLIDKWLDKRADGKALRPTDLRTLVAKNELPPKTDGELFALVMRRLSGIKHDVEDA